MTLGDFLFRGYYVASFNGSPPQSACYVEKHIKIGVSFALNVKGRSHAMNMPANVAPHRCPTQSYKFWGHRAGLAAPPATCAQQTASEYWRPFSCKERFGSVFIFRSSRITPSSLN